MKKNISISLTPYAARVLWGIVDGAADAGACEGGLTDREQEAIREFDTQLLTQHSKWKGAQ